MCPDSVSRKEHAIESGASSSEIVRAGGSSKHVWMWSITYLKLHLP